MSALTGPVADAGHPSPTGQQWTIGHGPYEATVVEVGGGLRTLTAHGVDLVAGFGQQEACQSGRGQQLMPWPNRLRDGRFDFGGKAHQLSITEVPRGNASHGLVRWALWELVEHEDDYVTVGYRLHPQPGWDWHLDLRTTYLLDETGLVVTVAARNVGAEPAPFGYGAHPYLSIGTTALPDVRLHVPASSWVEVDDRLLPAAVHSVEDTVYDFRDGHALADTDLDTAYTDVLRDDDGMWRVTVASDDLSVTLWADAAFPWLQVFTTVAREHKGAPGVAVEPMTCPADAFNSHESLIVLAPEEEWTGTWGVTPRAVPGTMPSQGR